MATTIYSQYSGLWSLSSVANAQALGTWPAPAQNTLWGWGVNTAGQLGVGTNTNYSSPKQVGSSGPWLKVASGTSWTIALQSNNTLWTWGQNYYGQLGNGTTTVTSSPIQVGLLKTWSTITSGSWGCAAIKTDGTLWTWGQGITYGALGLNNLVNYSSPKQVGALNTWAFVTTKEYSVAAIRTDGTLWTWGHNDYGQLGLGTSGAGTYKSSPTQVGALTNWSKIAFCISGTALAIKTNGTLWAWGNNTQGQLGIGNRTRYSSPKQVGALTTWAKIEGGYWNGLAIKTDGTLWVWGGNGNGDLGLGNTTDYSSPKQVGALTTWSNVQGGQYFSAGLTTDGKIWTWGSGTNGKLGQNNTAYYSSPKQVGTGTTWSAIATGESSTLALKAV